MKFILICVVVLTVASELSASPARAIKGSEGDYTRKSFRGRLRPRQPLDENATCEQRMEHPRLQRFMGKAMGHMIVGAAKYACADENVEEDVEDCWECFEDAEKLEDKFTCVAQYWPKINAECQDEMDSLREDDDNPKNVMDFMKCMARQGSDNAIAQCVDAATAASENVKEQLKELDKCKWGVYIDKWMKMSEILGEDKEDDDEKLKQPLKGGKGNDKLKQALKKRKQNGGKKGFRGRGKHRMGMKALLHANATAMKVQGQCEAMNPDDDATQKACMECFFGIKDLEKAESIEQLKECTSTYLQSDNYNYAECTDMLDNEEADKGEVFACYKSKMTEFMIDQCYDALSPTGDLTEQYKAVKECIFDEGTKYIDGFTNKLTGSKLDPNVKCVMQAFHDHVRCYE